MTEPAAPTDHLHIEPRTYVMIYVVLIVATYLTWQIAYFDLGPLNTVAALSIAIFKATLVVLFFMHARYSSRLTGLTVVAALFWLVILLGLTMSDYLTRGWLS